MNKNCLKFILSSQNLYRFLKNSSQKIVAYLTTFKAGKVNKNMIKILKNIFGKIFIFMVFLVMQFKFLNPKIHISGLSGFRSSSSINPSDSNSLKCWVLGFWAVFVIVALKRQSGAFGNQSKKVAPKKHQNWPFTVLKPLILALFSSEVEQLTVRVINIMADFSFH